MRPSFSYLDTVDTRVKTEQAAADAGDSSQEEAEEDAKPITVKFSRPESDEAKARRMASYEFHRHKYDGESWVPVEYHGLQDDMAVSERMLLQATQGDDLSEFQLFPRDYLARLVPPHVEEREEKPAMPSNILSLSQLRTLPLADQIKALLTNVKVIRFSQLMALLPQGTDTVSALRSVQQVAVLVQGCWVVKSDILYPKEVCSPHSGVSSEYLCRGRDYMMWKFTQSRHVIRKDISSIVKLPAEDVKDILEQMSKVKASKGWEFLFDYDKEFTDKYCEIVQRQKMLWDAKYQSLSKQFKIPKEAEKKSKAGEQSVGHTDKPRRRRTSSKSSPSKRERTLSGRSLSDHSDVEMEAAKNVAAGPVNITVEPMEVCDSNHVIANGPIAELTNSVVVENGGKCSSDLKQALIAFSRDILRDRLIFPLHELKRLFALKLQMCSPGHVLGCGVSDKQLEESLIEAGGIRLNNQWPPNSTNEPLFALLRKGDQYDTIRGVLFDLFRSSYQIRKEAFRKRIEEKTGQELSDADCKKLMREYCVVKAGGWWYLKGTVSES
ncbi:DNA-directed RNA polymerase III subunit RPC5-like isoform X2 [Gigantopelta aegis]|nr:DNA-directed RNA polymerase III subunit RPC5-like isoform X2 [Gigantopelta aegis]